MTIIIIIIIVVVVVVVVDHSISKRRVPSPEMR